MELSRALELRMEYAGESGVVKVDREGFICLNDMAQFFPSKRLDHWQENMSTQELIDAVQNSIIPGKAGIYGKRGKGGGTYAHELIAFDFAMWLSPEFKLKVYTEYMNGTQRKSDWNIQRIMAANNFKLMATAVESAVDRGALASSGFEYSNEARMLNIIVFGKPDKEQRDVATEEQLNTIAKLEAYNAAYIDIDMDYDKRKKALAKIYADMTKPKQIGGK